MDDAVDIKKLAEDDADYKEDEEVEDEKPQRGVVTAESDKLKQLNLLLDKARIYSQFISQQLQVPNAAKEDVKEEPVKEEEVTTKRRGRRPKNQKKILIHDQQTQSLQEKLEELPEKQAESLVRTVQPELVTGGKMRDYQLFGINWLIQLFENGMNGILADEMGLGKTIQTVSFLAHLWGKGITGPFLVVAPLSTLRNWANEFQKWTPSLPVVMYHGSKVERETLRGDITRAKKADGARPKIPIIITSYNIAMNDKRFLQCFHWKYLVVDEAHRLKNFNCRLIRELRALRTENRLLLTGTPLQNSLTELWSLLNFILPDIFDSLENFQSWFDFDEVIIKGDTEGKNVEENKDSISEQLVQKLHNILQPFLLRRLKHDVELNLPKKREYVLYCPFKPAQKAFYNLLKQHDWKKIVAGIGGRIKLLNIIMHLRKVCNHPFLFDDDFDSFYKKFKNNQIEIEEEEPPKQNVKTEETNGSGKKKRKRRGQLEEIENPPESRLRKKRRLNYDEIALFQKLEEEDEMEEEEQPEDESETEPKNKEPVMPKRGKSAWMIYFMEQRKEAAKKNPDAGMSDLFKICSAKWKALSDKEREVYIEKSKEDKRRYFAEVQTTLAEHNPSLVIEDPDKYLEDLKETCGKIELTEKMLKILLPNGHKTLIFSQMTRLLDILEDFLEYSGYSYCRIDGSTAQTDRQEQIELFNNDPNVSVFLLSTRAGGLGINLTAADSVIIYDSDWNPQMDMQAQDRCHRIGQTKPVCVYRLITANSVDSWILQRANAKLKLERLVIHKEKFKGNYSSDGPSNSLFSENEMLELLKSDATELGEDHVISDKDLERVCLDRTSLLNNKQGGFELIETNDGQSRLTVTK